MATIAETPGNIIIHNTPTTSETIRRVEPDHAERILGVHMAVNAQMTTEFTHRLSQARELAARIKKSRYREYKQKLPIDIGVLLHHIAYQLQHLPQNK